MTSFSSKVCLTGILIILGSPHSSQWIEKRHLYEGVCPVGWVDSAESKSCLQKSNHQHLVTWHKAREICQRKSGDLVKIVHLWMDVFVSEFIYEESKPESEQKFWIGLHKTVDEGKHDETTDKNVADCVHIQPRLLHFEAFDSPCTDKLAYICERPYFPLPKWTENCPHGWVVSTESKTCLRTGSKQRSANWHEARELCQREDADLIKIINDKMNTMVAALISNEDIDTFWIGLHDAKRDRKYVWLNETKSPTYSRWFRNDKTRSCVVGTKTDKVPLNVEWRSINCQVKQHYICEKPYIEKLASLSTRTENCPHGWLDSPESKTCLRSEKKHFVTWPRARELCQREGADLVKIINDKMSTVIEELPSDELAFWIGLHDAEGDGMYMWLDETRPPSYFRWLDGSPRADQMESCVVVRMRRQMDFVGYWVPKTAGWSNLHCHHKLAYICERPYIVTSSTSSKQTGMTTTKDVVPSTVVSKVSYANFTNAEPEGLTNNMSNIMSTKDVVLPTVVGEISPTNFTNTEPDGVTSKVSTGLSVGFILGIGLAYVAVATIIVAVALTCRRGRRESHKTKSLDMPPETPQGSHADFSYRILKADDNIS